MRLATKTLILSMIIAIIAIVWYQWSYSDKLKHILYPLEYRESIEKASEKYSLDPYLISAIIYVESKFNPSSESRAGAIGLMQIMPETGKWIASKQGRQFNVSDLNDPDTNIDMGCWYIKYLKAKYGNEKLAFAAYNSGHKNVDRWLRAKDYNTVDEMILDIPYEETRDFIKRVEHAHEVYKSVYPGEFGK